jgi:hypothetical protein
MPHCDERQQYLAQDRADFGVVDGSRTTRGAYSVAFIREIRTETTLLAPSECLGAENGKEGAEIIVRMALSGTDGPTGGYFDAKGALPW